LVTVVGKALANPEDDEERPLFKGLAVLAVFPVAQLTQVNPPVD
jgi:hypothetical protein